MSRKRLEPEMNFIFMPVWMGDRKTKLGRKYIKEQKDYYKKIKYYNANRVSKFKTINEFFKNGFEYNWKSVAGVLFRELFLMLAKDVRENRKHSSLFTLLKNVNQEAANEKKAGRSIKGSIYAIHLSKFYPKPKGLPQALLNKASKIITRMQEKQKGKKTKKLPSEIITYRGNRYKVVLHSTKPLVMFDVSKI